jgi:hypothetical protein
MEMVPTFVAQQTMHVPNVDQIRLVLAVDTERVLPLVDELENPRHGWWREGRGSLREPADELVEEVLGADLEVEGVAAVLDEDIEQLVIARAFHQSYRLGRGKQGSWARTWRASIATWVSR